MKNVYWSLAAVPACALMLAASSQPLVDYYLPWEWTKEKVIPASAQEGDDEASFSFPVSDYEEYSHAGTVSVKGFQLIDPADFPELVLPQRFSAWAVLTQWAAPEESILYGCRLWATADDGNKYRMSNSVLSDGMPDPNIDTAYGCTPPDASGPKLSWDQENFPDDFTKLALDPGEPRPEEYRKLTVIVVPDGVQPTQLHIGWEQPHMLTVELPEPRNFVDGAGDGAAGDANSA